MRRIHTATAINMLLLVQSFSCAAYISERHPYPGTVADTAAIMRLEGESVVLVLTTGQSLTLDHVRTTGDTLIGRRTVLQPRAAPRLVLHRVPLDSVTHVTIKRLDTGGSIVRTAFAVAVPIALLAHGLGNMKFR